MGADRWGNGLGDREFRMEIGRWDGNELGRVSDDVCFV